MNRGFTLTELLVVIFIIAVLIAILIPTISSVQRSAMTADTKNLISQLSSAITRYHQDFNAYPGPFSNQQILAGGTPRIGTTGPALSGASNITHSENLTLALLGGLRFDGSVFEFVADNTRQALGPASLNPNAPKHYAAYLNIRKGMLSEGRLADTYPDMTDSMIPEFLDTWPPDEQLPIIYVRARSGASGIVSDASTSPEVYQYDRRFFQPYLRDADELKDLTSIVPYLRHPSLGGTNNATGTPVGKDQFVLIAAGEDRRFGTADDITSWGN